MMILLQQILGVITIAQARQNLLDIATGLKFNTTSWQEGSWQRTLIEIFAVVYAAATHGVSQIAAGGYNDLAEDVWLHLLSDSHYDNQVHAAVATQGKLTLTSTSLAPPYPIAIDDLTAADANGLTFRNKTAGTLSSGGTLELLFEAESPGSAGNVSPGTITILKTPLAGVSITNPLQPDGSSWVTRDGADVETNPELRTRNRTKWATLGIGPGMAYVHNARQAHSSVKRVYVDDTNPDGPGTFDIYLAGDSGPASATIVAAVDSYLRGNTDGIDRKNATSRMRVFPAVARNFTLNAGVYLRKEYDTLTTRTAIEKAIADYFKELPIGGTPLVDGGPGAVRLAAISGRTMPIAGMQNIAFTDPTSDPVLVKNEVAVPVVVLTYYQI